MTRDQAAAFLAEHGCDEPGPVLDEAQRFPGRTVVRFDPGHGPYQFWRAGVQVECICDPGHLVCAYHAPADFDPARWELIPGPRTMAGVVGEHPGCGDIHQPEHRSQDLHHGDLD